MFVWTILIFCPRRLNFPDAACPSPYSPSPSSSGRLAVYVDLLDCAGVGRLAEKHLAIVRESKRACPAVDGDGERRAFDDERVRRFAQLRRDGGRLSDDGERRMLPVVAPEVGLHAQRVRSVEVERAPDISAAHGKTRGRFFHSDVRRGAERSHYPYSRHQRRDSGLHE